MSQDKEHKFALKSLLILGLYLICQAVADIAAVKIVRVGWIILPAGTFIYAITFTLIDLVNDRFGKHVARRLAVVAAVNNIFMVGYFWFASALPQTAGVPQKMFATVLLGVPRIVGASILAELVSELTDIEIFHFCKRKIQGKRWLRVIISNTGSSAVDSVVFTLAAFGGTGIPLLEIIMGQYAVKMAIAVFSIPLIYLVRSKKLSFNKS